MKIPGHNSPRPEAKHYRRFMDIFTKELERLNVGGLSLMLYGSYVRGDFVAGRSDIDAVLTFPYDVVISKRLMRDISNSLQRSLISGNIPFQVSPLDTTIMKDGRFNSFTLDFKDYFQSEGRIILGPDYREEMVYLKTKTGEESALSHNLRKARIGLLFAEYDRMEDYEKFLRGFITTLNAASRASKQVLFLADGKLRKERFSALSELEKCFPGINVGPLEEIKYLYNNTSKLDELYKDPDEVMKVWNSAATFFEELIREYIHKFPGQEEKVSRCVC